MNSVAERMPWHNLRYDPAICLDKMWRINTLHSIWMISKLNCEVRGYYSGADDSRAARPPSGFSNPKSTGLLYPDIWGSHSGDKIRVLRNVAVLVLVMNTSRSRCFGRAYCLHFQSLGLRDTEDISTPLLRRICTLLI